MRIMDGKHADPEDPSSMKYMPSIKKLGNKYYDEFIDHKTTARKDLAAKGATTKEY